MKDTVRLLFVLITHTHTHTHAHTLTQTHTQRFLRKMGKWSVTHHLVLSKTNGSTVNLGTITTRKNRKKIQEYEFKAAHFTTTLNSYF